MMTSSVKFAHPNPSHWEGLSEARRVGNTWGL